MDTKEIKKAIREYSDPLGFSIISDNLDRARSKRALKEVLEWHKRWLMDLAHEGCRDVDRFIKELGLE